MLSCSFKRLLLNLAADYDLNHRLLVLSKMEKKLTTIVPSRPFNC